MGPWNDIIVSPNMPLIEVLKILEHSGTQFVLVVDEGGRALGTITDGDIRRGLMRNISLQAECASVMNKDFYYLKSGNIKPNDIEDIRRRKINFIPILGKGGEILEIKSFESLNLISRRENEVLILAGGLGSRLGELTKSCPKPMLRVGDTPILESLIFSLKSAGFYKINLSVNYLSEMIEEYFESGSKWDLEIKYVKEKKRLGTAGPLSLVSDDQFSHPLLVLNGDLVTKVNYGALLDFHSEQQNAATICVRQHEVKIPYGVVEHEGNSLKALVEKPVKRFQVSAGIYVFSAQAKKLVPENSYFDMNHLFERLLTEEKSVGIFPIHEYWVDIGRVDDLERARSES